MWAYDLVDRLAASTVGGSAAMTAVDLVGLLEHLLELWMAEQMAVSTADAMADSTASDLAAKMAVLTVVQ